MVFLNDTLCTAPTYRRAAHVYARYHHHTLQCTLFDRHCDWDSDIDDMPNGLALHWLSGFEIRKTMAPKRPDFPAEERFAVTS